MIHPFDAISLWSAVKFQTVRDAEGRRNYYGTFQPIVDWDDDNADDDDDNDFVHDDEDDVVFRRQRSSTSTTTTSNNNNAFRRLPLSSSSSSPALPSLLSPSPLTPHFSFLTPLEETFGFLTELEHPPLVALLMRRPSGVRALECHVFKAGSDEEALDVVEALDICQVSHSW